MLNRPPGFYTKTLMILVFVALAIRLGSGSLGLVELPAWIYYILLAGIAGVSVLLLRARGLEGSNGQDGRNRQMLVMPALESVIDGLDYQPNAYIAAEDTHKLAFWKRNSFGRVWGNSYIKGSYMGMPFECSNMHLGSAGNDGQDLFRGVMLHTPAPDMEGIYITSRDLRTQFVNPFKRTRDELLHNGIAWYGMRIADPEMNRLFLAFGNRRQTDLPPARERLLAAANTARELTGSPTGLAVQDEVLWLVVDTGDDGLFQMDNRLAAEKQRLLLEHDVDTLTGLLEALRGLATQLA